MKIKMSLREKESVIRAFSESHFRFFGHPDESITSVILQGVSVPNTDSENEYKHKFSASGKDDDRDLSNRKALAGLFNEVVETLGYKNDDIKTIETDKNIIVSDNWKHYALKVIVTDKGKIRFEETVLKL